MLLDLNMRDVGGTALIKRLHRADAPVPFIVVTGQGDEKVAVEVMKQGALDYVMKDTGLLDLLPSVVRRALAAVERERSLADAQARFAAALRATNDGVWGWHIKEGRSYRSQWRIGQELHDGLGQQLTAIELMCQSLREDLTATQPGLAVQADRMGEFLRKAIGQTRSLAHGLTPFMLDAEGLRSGLAELVERTSSIG